MTSGVGAGGPWSLPTAGSPAGGSALLQSLPVSPWWPAPASVIGGIAMTASHFNVLRLAMGFNSHDLWTRDSRFLLQSLWGFLQGAPPHPPPPAPLCPLVTLLQISHLWVSTGTRGGLAKRWDKRMLEIKGDSRFLEFTQWCGEEGRSKVPSNPSKKEGEIDSGSPLGQASAAPRTPSSPAGLGAGVWSSPHLGNAFSACEDFSRMTFNLCCASGLQFWGSRRSPSQLHVLAIVPIPESLEPNSKVCSRGWFWCRKDVCRLRHLAVGFIFGGFACFFCIYPVGMLAQQFPTCLCQGHRPTTDVDFSFPTWVLFAPVSVWGYFLTQYFTKSTTSQGPGFIQGEPLPHVKYSEVRMDRLPCFSWGPGPALMTSGAVSCEPWSPRS